MEGLYSLREVTNFINNGANLILAGDESLLNKLPKGNWIGGTIPYFMGHEGGVFTKEKIFVNSFPDFIDEVSIRFYDETTLPDIGNQGFENGYTFLILPGFSNILSSFAQNSNKYENIFVKPLLGWVSGFSLAETGNTTAKVFNGALLSYSDNLGVAMHIKLPAGKTATLDMVNIFKPGDGDIITFPDTTFTTKDCFVNGIRYNFADYLELKNIDTKLPLVANYYGAMINTCLSSINQELKEITFYAPVFKDVEYHIAAPITDYVLEFTNIVSKLNINPIFSCNCILNYLYSNLEGKKTFGIIGPITFGEIAYQLLNQTLIYLTIEDNEHSN